MFLYEPHRAHQPEIAAISGGTAGRRAHALWKLVRSPQFSTRHLMSCVGVNRMSSMR